MLDGQKVEYHEVVAEELRSEPGGPVASAQITATSSPTPGNADGVVVDLPLLAPGEWEFDGSEPSTNATPAYPRIDVHRSGRRYRCYPGMPNADDGSEPVRCEVRVTDRSERVVGTFSGVFVEVDEALQPLATTVEVAQGKFEAAMPEREEDWVRTDSAR